MSSEHSICDDENQIFFPISLQFTEHSGVAKSRSQDQGGQDGDLASVETFSDRVSGGTLMNQYTKNTNVDYHFSFLRKEVIDRKELLCIGLKNK